MNEKSIKTRIIAIRNILRERTLDSLIITDSANVTYTTGFQGNDSFAFITARAAYLVTDSRYTEQAHKECINWRIIERNSSMADQFAQIIKKHPSIKTAAIEDSTSLAQFNQFRKKLKIKLKAIPDIIEDIRSVKDPSEITQVKKAVKIAALAIKNAFLQIKPGITETHLAAIIDLEIRKAGGTNSFETIVAFGPNASRPHHQPTLRKLKKNDSILIDFGARVNSYCCDVTRCFTVGKAFKLYQTAYQSVKQAQAAAIATIAPGAKIADIDAVARKIIAQNNLPLYGHGTGHGLGLCVHEKPVISGKSNQKLAAGMLITIEPGVYIPGKFGIRIEDDVLVTETGAKVLTAAIPK